MVLDPNSTEQMSLPDLLNNLSFDDVNSNETLVNVRIFLSKIPAEDIYAKLTNNVLESFIRTASIVAPGESLDLCREILDTVLLAIPPTHLLKRFHAEVLFALNSKSTMIKISFLHSIRRAFEADSAPVDDVSTTNAPILIAICRCLVDSDVSVFQEAELTLISLAKTPKGPSILFNSNIVVDTLKEMLSCQDTVKRFRMHDLTADFCRLSPEILSYCAKENFIQSLLNEVTSNDVLGQLNALEIITNMAAGSKHCLEYLKEKGVLNKLHDFLIHSQESPDSSFLFPAVMRLFGHLGRLYPKECNEKYPKFLEATFQLVINYHLMEVGQRLLAFDTLGLLASTPDGKAMLSKFDVQMQRCMKCFGQCVREGPMDMRVRHLEALSDLLKLEPADQTPELLSLTEKWFTWFDKSPTEVLFGIFKQPFDSIHCAAGDVFKRIAVQSWGQKAMFQQAGFSEYLLNRSAETTMEGRHTKFDIVDLLVNSPTINDAVDAPLLQRLKQYRSQGAYYVQGQLDVAMDEG